MDLKELWERHKREKAEEKEYQRRRERGEVEPEELSPKEQREQIEAARKQAEEVAKGAQRIRAAERGRRAETVRAQARAHEEAQAAEERARVLETELYGTPLTAPEEIIRDRWGREIGKQPLAAKRREEAAKLEMAQRKMTERGIGLIEARYKEAEEAIKERRIAKRRAKVLGPVSAIARGVAGTVEAVGRGLPIGVRTGPYGPARMPSVLPTPRPIGPTGPPGEGLGLSPRGMDLSHLRDLQMQTPKIRQPGKPKGKNTYGEQMRRMRRTLFGG